MCARSFIFDTNVLIVANGRAVSASAECQLQCIDILQKAVSQKCSVSIDSLDLILSEYRRYVNFSGAPGVGDYFFRYLHDHLGNPTVCEQVLITPRGRSFAEFPSVSELKSFDFSDRKFVAVQRASLMNPIIVNATDSDWRDFESEFASLSIPLINLLDCCS